MKNSLKIGFLYVFASVLVLAFSSVMAAAQQFVPAKAAVIQSDAFYDEKAGITKLVKAQAALEAEFKPREDEIVEMAAKIDKLNKETADLKAELSKLDAHSKMGQNIIIDTNTSMIRSLEERIKLKQDYTKKMFELRQDILVKPIFVDVSKALGEYAKSHGIDILIDLSKAQGVFYFSTPPDITKAFIADYNSKHPTP